LNLSFGGGIITSPGHQLNLSFGGGIATNRGQNLIEGVTIQTPHSLGTKIKRERKLKIGGVNPSNL
jgi:hypothetical protein